MYDLKNIIGLSVFAIKAGPKEFGRFEAKYILFSDRKTFIHMEEQDYYTFHDCSSAARYINVYISEKLWVEIEKYKDATHGV